MTGIEVQGAVVVATMRDVAGRVYEADAPVLDGRGGLPSPLGRSYLYRLAILIRPDDFLSVSRCSQRSQHFSKNLRSPAARAQNQKNAHVGRRQQLPNARVACLELVQPPLDRRSSGRAPALQWYKVIGGSTLFQATLPACRSPMRSRRRQAEDGSSERERLTLRSKQIND